VPHKGYGPVPGMPMRPVTKRDRAEHVEYNVAGHEIDTVMAARRSIITGAGDKRERVRRLQHERRCRSGRLGRS
jgi:hypothetical protein